MAGNQERSRGDHAPESALAKRGFWSSLIGGGFSVFDRHPTHFIVASFLVVVLVLCVRYPAEKLPDLVSMLSGPATAWKIAAASVVGLILAVAAFMIQRRVYRRRLEEMVERNAQLERQLMGKNRPSSKRKKGR